MSAWRSVVAAVGILCSGCMGKIGGNPMGSGNATRSGDPGDPASGGALCAHAGGRRVRRLSQREYFEVVSDLLGPDAVVLAAGMLPPEPSIAGFDNQDIALRAASAFQEGIAN